MKYLLILFLLLINSQAHAYEYYYVSTGSLNIRNGPSSKNEVIGNLSISDSVQVILLKEHGWSYILTEDGIDGYVSTKYLTKNKNEIGNINEAQKIKEEKIDKEKGGYENFLEKYWFVILLGLYGIYKLFFRSNSSKSKSSSAQKRQEKAVSRFLEIRSGDIFHRKEGSTGSNRVYSGGDAIDFDLEDSHDERTRFLVVTRGGNVLLCKTYSTGKEIVYREFVSFGHAHKANFVDSNSFIFQTDKGTFKGYFNSTKKDRLR
jgi:hypothetical protein